MQVNADADQGELRVEVLTPEGNPIDGLTAGDCRPITTDGLRHQIEWSAGKQLASLQGQTVRLRFHLSGRTQLFAFAIVDPSRINIQPK